MSGLLTATETDVTGQYVRLDGEDYFRIENSHCMPGFFMSITGASDHWMFISSSGALTAGRKNSDFALFPYASDDQISAMQSSTGPVTLIRPIDSASNPATTWEPFSTAESVYGTHSQNIYKTPLGNKIVFEETNETLGLSFRYRWAFSEKFGFVRSCRLTNTGQQKCELELLDGFRNILPYGIGREFMMRFSNLANAYKKSELLPESNLGIYYLSSIPTDRAEPSEGLKATTVWQSGLDAKAVLISPDQINSFRQGDPVTGEIDARGKVGAYIQTTSLVLEPGESKEWITVAELSQNRSSIVELDQWINTTEDTNAQVENDIQLGEFELLKIAGSSDAVQVSTNPKRTNRHLSNTIFNVMRGGIPVHNYDFPISDFVAHVKRSNAPAYARNQSFLENLNGSFNVEQLQNQIKTTEDGDLVRLANEYLPLTFGRRHGDPTRPWNHFSIDVRTDSGDTNLDYQGNWRDIFQNWEAVGVSFPSLLPGMVSRFLNATTADGYNPYRVTKAGFEWEEPAPDDPWSNIGYWGDHQIIYLLKLMEWSRAYDPEKLAQSLTQKNFVHANIPYRIKPFEDIKKDPQSTIEFDWDAAKQITQRVDQVGADGKLLCGINGDIQNVSMIEKLLTLSLAKLSNFVPDGGIWLNTQRPEWNDANNALVGNGLSMVTTCYLYRWFGFLQELVGSVAEDSIEITKEVADFQLRLKNVFAEHSDSLTQSITDSQRYEIVESLSLAGSDYRQSLYGKGFSGEQSSVAKADCVDFFDDVLKHLEKTIRNNRRSDGLSHTYNLIEFGDGEARVNHLYEMLEGQVAVLSAGLLEAEEVVELLDGLRKSSLYRENQNSYILYPDRDLPRFLEKNQIENSIGDSISLIKKLEENGDRTIIDRDAHGVLHFNGQFKNSNDVREALNELGEEFQREVESCGDRVCDLFEEVFNHAEFTGRSCTFFAYEGLGSIYWHMVSKLGLAVVENLFWAIGKDATGETIEALRSHFHEIRSGIGAEKTPTQYGAFPTDPYSHTPENAGVKQPGMTGQVKEDLLSRFSELGIQIKDGCLGFQFDLLDESELLDSPLTMEYVDVAGEKQKEPLAENSLGFTFCQVPVVIRKGTQNRIEVTWNDGKKHGFQGLCMDRPTSRDLFLRTGKIRKIVCEFCN